MPIEIEYKFLLTSTDFKKEAILNIIIAVTELKGNDRFFRSPY